MKWYSVLALEAHDSEEIILDAEVPADSPWFDGHFPEDPILPGIAQLEMAVDTIRLAHKRNISAAGFRKVRFKRVIRPGEKLKIIATARKANEGSYAFRILVENELACNGVFFVQDPYTANMKEEAR
ncbi:MAG: hypothetical protein K9N10_19535 [Deltaproteobacteria bacterium]|nr:hypothetical protein [Deltaproteobacteria bacterium]